MGSEYTMAAWIKVPYFEAGRAMAARALDFLMLSVE